MIQSSYNFLRVNPIIPKSVLKRCLYVNFLLLIYFTSCKTKNYVPKKILHITSDSAIVLSNNPLHIYRKSNSNTFDIRNIKLIVNFDWEKAQLLGKEVISFEKYKSFKGDTLVLDAKNFEIKSISLNKVELNSFEYKKDKIRIDTRKNYIPGSENILELEYIAQPNNIKQKGGRAIRSAKGLYFINNNGIDSFKPKQIWTQGEPESNSGWFACIDKPNEKSTFEISITAADSFDILSNGKLVSEIKNQNIKTSTWLIDKPMSSYLVMMAIGKYSIIKDTCKSTQLQYYVEPDYKISAKKMFEHTGEMVDFFSEKLGVAYPWEKYSQVVVRDYVSGAMENTSATILGEFVQKQNEDLEDNDNESIVAHELFHQWFGDLVTCESWSNLVLNEGFATFGEQLWYEHKYGSIEAEYDMYNSLNSYIRSVQFSDDPIVRYHYKTPDDMFNAITYQKGSRVLNLLRYEMGDELFFEGLKKYLETYKYKNAEVHQFRLVMEELSGMDLSQFFEQWFFSGGHPILEIEYNYLKDQKLDIIVKQKNIDSNKLFYFPLEIKLLNPINNKEIIKKYTINKRTEIVTVDYSEIFDTDSIKPIIYFDAAHNFIGEFKEKITTENVKQNYIFAKGYIDKVRALDALIKAEVSNEEKVPIFVQALKDENKYIRNFILSRFKFDTIKPYTLYNNEMENIALNDDYIPNQVLAIRHLSNVKEKKYTDKYKKIYNNTQNSKLKAESFSAISKSDTILSLQLAKENFNTTKNELCIAIAEFYTSSNNKLSIDFFEYHIPRKFSTTRNWLMQLYFKYAKQQELELQNKILNYILHYCNLENMENLKKEIISFKEKK